MIEELDCLTCGGRGKQFYICGMNYIPCAPCGGTGRSLRDSAWVPAGRALRTMRVQRDMSLGDLARAANVSVVEVSSAERGRSDPSELSKILVGLRPTPEVSPWTCKAKSSATDPPQDCDWPRCGCDPKANQVIEALEERGWIAPKPGARGPKED